LDRRRHRGGRRERRTIRHQRRSDRFGNGQAREWRPSGCPPTHDAGPRDHHRWRLGSGDSGRHHLLGSRQGGPFRGSAGCSAVRTDAGRSAMNARPALALVAAIATAALGCTKLLRNRCDQQSDCPTNYTCDSTKTCVSAGSSGGGGSGGAGGSKGTGGMSFSCSTCKGANPICDLDAGACRACTDSTACLALDAGTNVCVPEDAGASKGMCVDCVSNSDCPLKTKPICVSNACAPCVADSDCAGTGPGVCIHDGHCATDDETIYVQQDTSICNDTPPASDGG